MKRNKYNNNYKSFDMLLHFTKDMEQRMRSSEKDILLIIIIIIYEKYIN